MSAGGRRARGELSRRLRAQMVRVGLSHAELATAADLSVIVIDDALNPAKDPVGAELIIHGGDLRYRGVAALGHDRPPWQCD